MQPSLESNLTSVRREIGAAAVRSGRDAQAVRLLAVTKSVDAAIAAELCALGQTDLGENRADELERKCRQLEREGARPRWHFVGHLQRNKARRVVQHADVIHSVDSPALLVAIDRLAGELGRRPALFLQVKLYPEREKAGLDPRDVADVVEQARSLANVNLSGLMTMAPLIAPERERARAARGVFTGLRELSRTLDARAFDGGHVALSMGMSDDFEIAIECGSDWVRIGTRLFGAIRGREHGEAVL